MLPKSGSSRLWRTEEILYFRNDLKPNLDFLSIDTYSLSQCLYGTNINYKNSFSYLMLG